MLARFAKQSIEAIAASTVEIRPWPSSTLKRVASRTRLLRDWLDHRSSNANMTTQRLAIALLASHAGTGAQAVVDACTNSTIHGDVVAVISNNSKSEALSRARKNSITTFHLSSLTHNCADDLDVAILNALESLNVDVVVLVGYMKRLGPRTLTAFTGRVLNIHPSLLPKHGGRGMYGNRVHQAVLDSGDVTTGATIHLVDSDYDTGSIIAQTSVHVAKNDTAQSLADRVRASEHNLLVQVLSSIATGKTADSTDQVT